MTKGKKKKETDEEAAARRVQWLKEHVNLDGPMSDKWWEDGNSNSGCAEMENMKLNRRKYESSQ